MAIERSYNFHLIGYFLSRFGEMEKVGSYLKPPLEIGVDSWIEAYDLFYDVIGGDRQLKSYRNSLKNTRDSFDSHVENNRVGWRESDVARTPGRLSRTASKVMEDNAQLSRIDVYGKIEELLDIPAINEERRSARSGRRGGGGQTANLIGKVAEQWVYRKLHRMGVTNLVHHSMRGETPGYDLSFTDSEGKFQAVEVKGTSLAKMKGFNLTGNEFKAAEKLKENYTLWLITNVGQNPQKNLVNNPPARVEAGQLVLKVSAWDVVLDRPVGSSQHPSNIQMPRNIAPP